LVHLVDCATGQPAGQLEKYCQVAGDIDTISMIHGMRDIPLDDLIDLRVDHKRPTPLLRNYAPGIA
jgi:hypothetical protein